MKERPILFKAPMVRSILDGRKSQTRRVVRPQPPSLEDIQKASGASFSICERSPGVFAISGPVWAVRAMGGEVEWRCPYGQSGDRLWVRETWYCDHCDIDTHGTKQRPEGCDDSYLYYRATDGHRPGNFEADGPVWRPSIFMPRWASRILLEVVNVRVERLKAITEADAEAEGVERPECDRARGAYATLWDKINRKSWPWVTNPWVWVVEFRRVP